MRSSQEQSISAFRRERPESSITGLSSEEALRRLNAGRANRFDSSAGRPLGQILKENVLTAFNMLVLTLGVLLLVLGHVPDALWTLAVILFHIVIGVTQELRAKAKLSKIALLSAPRATVLRDGKPESVRSSEVVEGDVCIVEPGDQILGDGYVVSSRGLELDESMLTGESDTVRKKAGDLVYSGSLCDKGTGRVLIELVGKESFANKLALEAKKYHRLRTPMEIQINKVFQILLISTAILSAAILVIYPINRRPFEDVVLAITAVVTLVPIGLVFSVIVGYALGAVRIAAKGVLVQSSEAIESLSHVTTLCMDKTGTLTTNELKVISVTTPSAVPDTTWDDVMNTERVIQRLTDYAASLGFKNRTIQAIEEQFPGAEKAVAAETEFSSVTKFSRMVFEDERNRSYWLGAPEALGLDSDYSRFRSGQGLRILAFAVGGSEGEEPQDLSLLCYVEIEDTLREEAKDTIEQLRQVRVEPKLISGDAKETVASLAKWSGIAVNPVVYTGDELAVMEPEELSLAARKGNAFARVQPQQKQQLIKVLQSQGRYVAMIGDGVNDILAIKSAQVGLAMQSGTAATRNAAEIVLLGDTFAGLPKAFEEGRRIVLGLDEVLALYVTRAMFLLTLLALMLIAFQSILLYPRQVALQSWLTVGMPAFLVILSPISWRPVLVRLKRTTRRNDPKLGKRLEWFEQPLTVRDRFLVGGAQGLIAAVVLFAPMVYFALVTPDRLQSSLTLGLIAAGLTMFVMSNAFPWPPVRRVWKIAGAMSALALAVYAFPFTRETFGLHPVDTGSLVLLAAGTAVLAALLLITKDVRAPSRIHARRVDDSDLDE